MIVPRGQAQRICPGAKTQDWTVGLSPGAAKGAIYIHSNVRLPLGPLRILLGAPELHHWHHDKDRRAGNYANISPIRDVLFGNYRCPNHEPESFGIDHPISKTYLGQMLHPFRRGKRSVPRKLIPPEETVPAVIVT